MRVLGIDLGSKTCGIAISDSTNKIASGLYNLRYENNDLMIVINKLKQIFNNYNNQIDTFVIGYPTYNNTNQKCNTSLLVDKFVNILKIAFKDIKVVLINENYSTIEANNYLMQFDIKASQRKKVIDQVAACVILQKFLDKKNNL